MNTRITELFGIKHPIVQGGMHNLGRAELGAAIPNAGRHGIITTLTQRTPELLAKATTRCKELSDALFGVNLSFLPTLSSPPYPKYIVAIAEGGVRIAETSGRNSQQYMSTLKAAELW